MNFIVKLSKEYTFEGHKYTEVDLSGIQDFTTADICDINTKWRIARGSAVLPEYDMLWACYAGAKAAKQPVEFFSGLPAKDGKKVRDLCIEFFQD